MTMTAQQTGIWKAGRGVGGFRKDDLVGFE